MSKFGFFYLAFLSSLWLIFLPLIALFSFKAKYRQSIKSRFFLYKNPPLNPHKFWFHGCSFGEIVSFTPFLQMLPKVALTATTQTGYTQAKKMSKNVRYLPFEIFLPFWIKTPYILIVSEAELWFMLFFVAKKRGATTFLINARISDKSYKSYKRFSCFYKKIFSNVDFVFAQSEIDKIRLHELGAKNIKVVGNIKTALKPNLSKNYTKPSRRVITLASTHEGEEELILEHLKLETNDMLIIAPRHPERFDKVCKLVQKYAQKYSLTCKTFSVDDFVECDILILDALGELNNIYTISDVSVLCGSFLPCIGGHNPIEPAFFGNVIISGEFYHNHKSTYALVDNIYICKASQISYLLADKLKPSSVESKDSISPIIKAIREEDERRKSL